MPKFYSNLSSRDDVDIYQSTKDFRREKEALFIDEFDEELAKHSFDDILKNDIENVKEMVLIEKLNPAQKPILEEWRNLFPEDFNVFLSSIAESAREKLISFLNISHD